MGTLKPYIGITGFMKSEEVRAILSTLPQPPVRNLMVGVLASWKTLHGIPNKHPHLFPEVNKMRDIFLSHPNALNLIHYSTDNPETLYGQLVRLQKLGGLKLHGFQLNMAWPNVNQLNLFRERWPYSRIVLQIGSEAVALMDNSPITVSRKLDDYGGLITDILFDPSGGRGKPFNTARALLFLGEIAKRNPYLGLGVAGGLSSSNLRLVEPLLPNFPNLSIDAQVRLRNQAGNMDLEKATAYVTQTLQMFSRL